jgi:Ni/Fe-hydrogenase subunit HybB-like protein
MVSADHRRHPFWRMVALSFVVIGVIAFRWDTNLSGLLVVMPYIPGQTTVAYVSYVPSLIEVVAGLGIVAYGLLAFSLGVRYLNVVNHRLATEEVETVAADMLETAPA